MKPTKGDSDMKKLSKYIITVAILISLAGCGNIRNVKIIDWTPSELYSDKDIQKAINVIKTEFALKWDGCTLTEITYAGDDVSLDYKDWAIRNNAKEVIVLTSSFEVDSSGGDGSLNPNSTYSGWMWILARSDGGKWKHVDHGY